ncbi:MAG: ComF family protein [Oscillospiraceae bacterium]|jgi:ComF family protein|nr:ComF family protein [Oscillospiraceae bacterium]
MALRIDFTFLLDLLFPEKCPYCVKPFSRRGEYRCAKCADGLVAAPTRRDAEAFYDRAVSAFVYVDSVRDAVIRYKFSGHADYARSFGRAVAERLRGEDAVDLADAVVTWVPLSRKRLKERGYDQAELLARAAAKSLKLQVLPTLRRVRNTAANSSISGGDGAKLRRENVENAFEVAYPATVRGAKLLLIDDVITTGATLSQCARVLKMSGAETVIAATLAGTGNR